MNKIFRRVFNAARGTIVAVEETKSSHSQSNAKGETIMGGGYKPLALAVSGVLALGFSSSALAVDEPDWVQISKTADIKVNVEGNQTTGTGVGIQTSDKDIGSGDQVIYVSGKNITGGANASAGMMATGGKKAQVDKGGSIYVEGNGGYASGLSAGWGQQNQILNKGTIYVKGAGDDKVKGMSVDDGFAQNQGTIYVWDALGMVSNSQGNANTNRLKNQGTIEVYGGAGMVDNKSNDTTEKVLITNKGTINVQKGDGIRVSESSTRGETVIHNAGTINADEGANAINVASTSHEINIRLEDGADINGTIKVASDKKSGLNQTRLTVDNAGEQDVSLDAQYLDQVLITDSSLTITNVQDKLTIDGMDLTNGHFAIADTQDELTLIINDLTKDENSSVDYGNAKVTIWDDSYDVYGSENFSDLIIGDQDHAVEFVTTTGSTTNVENNFVLNNKSYKNESNSALNVQGNATIASGTTLTNGNETDSIEDNTISTVRVDGNAYVDGTVNNYGQVSVAKDLEVGSGQINNNGIVRVDGTMTLGDQGVVENYGDLYLTVLDKIDKKNGTGILNNHNQLILTGAENEIAAYVNNMGSVDASGKNVVISDDFLNSGAFNAAESTIALNSKFTNEGNGIVLNGNWVIDQTGSFENTGANAQAIFDNLTVYDGKVINNSFMVAGTLTGTGHFENHKDFTVTDVIANNGFDFLNDEGATTTVSGNASFFDLTNKGTINVAGSMSLFGGETAVNEGTLTVGSLSTEGDSVLVNRGTVTVGSTLDGVNYTQSGVNAEISFADDVVTNSTITLTDGAAWAHLLGTGNTYIVESSQTLNVANGGHLDAGWASNFSQIVTDAVTADNQFFINEGGVLKFNTLGAAGEAGAYITVNGGALQTSLGQIFDGVAYDDGMGHRIEDADQVAVVGANTVSGFSEVAKSAIGFGENGGYIVFDDEHYFDSITDSIDDALLGLGYDNSDKITIAFTGTNESNVAHDIAWANEKLHNVESGANFVFGDIALDASGSSEYEGPFYLASSGVNGKLVMDGTLGTGSVQLGVSHITGTNEVDVVDGAHLTLVGDKDNSISLIGENGGSATINNAVLTLTGGKGRLNLADVSNGGVIEVVGGTYDVGILDVQELGRLDVQAGTLDVGNLTSAGEMTNAGELLADNITLTGGHFVNDGFTHADYLTVAENGSWTNNQQASWGTLAIRGEAVNDGYETVTDYQLEANGVQTNYGTHRLENASIQGTYENVVNPDNAEQAGWVNVSGVLTIDQSGEFKNNGRLEARDMVVNGTLTNAGTVLASNLTGSTGGTVTNQKDALLQVTEEATFNTLTNHGDIAVGGNMSAVNFDNFGQISVEGALSTFDDSYVVNGEEALLVVGADAQLQGVLGNFGQIVVGGDTSVDQAVNAEDGKFAAFGNMTVAESFDNQGTLGVAKNLTIDGKFINSGKTYVDGAVTVDGTLTQTEGEFLALGGETGNVINGTINVTGGKFMLGDTTTAVGAVISASNGATAQMVAADDKLSGRINVDGATFTLGNALPDTLSNVDEPQHEASSIFNMNQQAVDLGAEGIIAVGNGAKDVELTGGSVWFGSDSLLALNTSTYDGDSGFFKGEGSFVVEDGAQIQVSDASIGWGTYTLVSDGFKDVDLAEGGWLEHENIIYTGDKDIDLTIRENEDGNVEITIGSNNILEKLPDVAIPNLVNEVIADPHRSPNESGVKGFLAGAIENGILSENLQAEVINDTAQIMAAGGVMVQGMTLVGNVLDITDRHLSYEDVHFKNGQLQRFDGVRLWADALGQRVDASGYDFSGSSAEFDGYNTGFILGADLMASCDARYGAAFAYQNANIDSNGSAVKTSNEADAYTFALYAAKTFGNFNFIGSLAYTRIDSDLEQSLPGALGAKQGKHTMDVQNDIYTLGLKGEYNIALSKSGQAVPYVGVRAVWMDTSDEKSKMAHQDAFDYDTDSVTQVQFPIGVAFQGTTETKSGWTGRGVIDFSVTPVAGDKDVDTTITANGLTAEDVVNTEFADDLTGAVRIGISAEKDNMAFGGNLGFSTGGSRDGNVTFGLNARYRF